jgi:hypothetical protein
MSSVGWIEVFEAKMFPALDAVGVGQFVYFHFERLRQIEGFV